MQLYSTKNPAQVVNLEQAVFQSLPPDNGLYMPMAIPQLPDSFFSGIAQKTFTEIAFEVAAALLGDSLPSAALQQIVAETLSFPAPIRPIAADRYVLELFHGPSMAFKDFGARFMSRLMHYFLEKDQREINILVATSGDTGGAVALGFYDVPGIKVTILYPKGKVSPLQEQQLTTLGKNITALEVAGTFDDCQRLVKTAFLDPEITRKAQRSSANSINIARLIPQTFYYFNAYAQLQKSGDTAPPVFSVPSGNFGNLTAGLIAWKMGLPVAHFVAATNVNDVVPAYLKSGIFEPRPSLQTLSNAMDVGNPSNFERMQVLFKGDVESMREMISGYRFTDAETQAAIREVFDSSGYIMCPHTAVAYAGLKKHQQNTKHAAPGVFLSSAHPCKFPNVYPTELWEQITLPPQVAGLEGKEKQAIAMGKEYAAFKQWLLNETHG